MTPNPEADTEGYAYDVTLLPNPIEGRNVDAIIRLNEIGDMLYPVFDISQNRSISYIQYNHGTLVSAADLGYPGGGIYEINSSRSMIMQYRGDDLFVLLSDGTEVRPSLLENVSRYSLQDLADTGYASVWQEIVTSYIKVRGQQVAQYEYRGSFMDPLGNTFTAIDRPDLVNGLSDLVLNEQLVTNPNRNNQLEPVVVSLSSWILSYPGYDNALFSELMDETEQLEFMDLISNGVDGYDHCRMTTPRNADGSVNHSGAPSFCDGAYPLTYPDGTSGYEGIFVIRPVTP